MKPSDKFRPFSLGTLQDDSQTTGRGREAEEWIRLSTTPQFTDETVLLRRDDLNPHPQMIQRLVFQAHSPVFPTRTRSGICYSSVIQERKGNPCSPSKIGPLGMASLHPLQGPPTWSVSLCFLPRVSSKPFLYPFLFKSPLLHPDINALQFA